MGSVSSAPSAGTACNDAQAETADTSKDVKSQKDIPSPESHLVVGNVWFYQSSRTCQILSGTVAALVSVSKNVKGDEPGEEQN